MSREKEVVGELTGVWNGNRWLIEIPEFRIKSIHIRHSDVDRFHNPSIERLMYWTAYPRDQCTWEAFAEPFPLEDS